MCNKSEYLRLRDAYLLATKSFKDPNRRVVWICRLAELAREKRLEEAEIIKRACFHACLEALKQQKKKGSVS
ncbi:MAG: hypothetical protein PHS52_03295 [Desulfotomaculaceae bacterium]|nr:hypothetical protein [Desulfotomaculaceae bacterium]